MIFSKSSKLVYEIAKEFDVEEIEDDCDYCGGDDQYEEETEAEDEDGDTYTEYETVTCYECGGSGTNSYSTTNQVVNGDRLDSKMYKVNNRLFYDLERYVSKLLLD